MKIYLTLFLIAFATYAKADGDEAAEEEGQTYEVCPEVIRYNVSYFVAHFNMTKEDEKGFWFKLEYKSEEKTPDLPPGFEEGEERSFACHAYMMLAKPDIMWLSHCKVDQIFHWYSGATAKFYVYNRETQVLRRMNINAKNVVGVVEAGELVAAEMTQKAGDKDDYVLIGRTMAPCAEEQDGGFIWNNEVNNENTKKQGDINLMMRLAKKK